MRRKKNRASEVKLLVQLRSNLETNENRLIESIEFENRCANSVSIIVNNLDRNLHYHDSLNSHFQYVFYSGDVVRVMSAHEAIKSKGFDIIMNDSLRSAIIDLFDANYALMLRETIGLEDLIWPSVVLPLYMKHMRHGPKKEELVPKNYELLLADSEFVSIIESRGKIRLDGAELKKESLHLTLLLIDQIEKELQ